MIEVATARINSFARKEQSVAFSVQPSNQLINLTLGQLQDLIMQAIQEATAPLEARLQDLQARLDAIEVRGVGPGEGGEERIRTLPGGQETQIATFQVFQDLHAENVALKRELCDLQEITARERAYDRQRITKLEHREPQPLQKDRAEILRALIAANGGKMLAKDARKKMHLSRSRFSELLATMKDQIEVKPFHLKKSQNVLILI